MIQINKLGNAIIIEFTDNDKYLFNGIIEIAPNELMVVVDESNVATFKRISNGDTLFAQNVGDIQINGITATKDTVIDLFGSIGYTSGGGGGTGAVSSVNGQTGDVVITAAGIGAMTRAQADEVYASKEELEEKQEVFQVNAPMSFERVDNDLHLSIDLTNYAKETDLGSKADSSTVEALSTEIATVSTNVSNLTTKVNEDSDKIASLDTEMGTKQDTLVSGTNIKTINNLSILGEGNINITGGGVIDSELSETSENPVQNKVINSALNNKVDKVEGKSLVSDTDITKLEELKPLSEIDTVLANKQDTLVSGTNIKTVNGNSLLGEGNIAIQGGTFKELYLKDNLTPEELASNKEIFDTLLAGIFPSVYVKYPSMTRDFSTQTEHYILVGVYMALYLEDFGLLFASSGINLGKYDQGVHVTLHLDGTIKSWSHSSSPVLQEAYSRADFLANKYLTVENGKLYLSQKRMSLVTEVGEGLADAYDVKQYVDSHSSGVTVDSELSTESENPVQNKVITNSLNDKATKTELNTLSQEVEHKADKTTVYTMDEVNTKLATKQATLVAGDNITLSDPDSEGKVTIAATQPDISGITTTVEELTGEVATLSTDKQDKLISGTNIKTINGESILGTGNIEITGGTVDTAMSDTSENAVQNKVIKAYIDNLVGNILTKLQEINGDNI